MEGFYIENARLSCCIAPPVPVPPVEPEPEPDPDPLLLRILTNNAGASLPWADQTEFEAAMASDNPSLSVSSYSLVGNELTVMGTGLVKMPDGELSFIAEIIEVESETIEETGVSSFSSCTSLTSVDFPNVTTIGIDGFSSCVGLTEATFPLATGVGDNAFKDCSSLDTAYFPLLTSLSEGVFYGTALETASFPEVVTIGKEAFSGCDNLTSVSFPKATFIGESAFYSNYGLTSVTFPLVEETDVSAFSSCIYLATVSFPALETVGNTTFDETAIVAVNTTNFPSVTYWGDEALKNCTSLETFETNASVVRPDVLSNCTALIDVTLNNATALFDIFGSNAYLDSKAVNNMTFSMPNLNNIINNPFADIISNGIIGGGTDFTITIPSAMGAATRITEAQSAGAIIVTV
ncbi:MAG TPA: leucine-rich repeat domain-containing protein [Ferruginibacter sp.]|nr:leucine-rich repeat domain-containing protein [Ferruginibacter sp.]